jgi:predicted dehydrogenase
MLKVALVGCGKAAETHVNNIHRLGCASLAAVCDSEIIMAEQLAVRHGIPRYYSDFSQLLAEQKPDVVHITTPPQSHLALALQSLQAGAHLFVEKPLAGSYAECETLIEAVIRSRKKLTTGYFYGFDPAARRLRQTLESGRLGKIVHVETFFGYDLASRFAQAALTDEHHWLHSLDGTLLRNVLDHPVFGITNCFSVDHSDIQCLSWRSRRLSGSPVVDQVPDELRVMITGENTSAYLTLSSQARPVSYLLTVYGTAGTVHVDFVGRTVTSRITSGLPGALGRVVPPFHYGWQYFRDGLRKLGRLSGSELRYDAGFTSLLSAFYDSIASDHPVPISYEQMLRVSQMVDRICAQTAGNRATREWTARSTVTPTACAQETLKCGR